MSHRLYIILLILFPLTLSAQEQGDCDDEVMPYWANGINSRIEGENVTIRKAYSEIQHQEHNISPKNGFITIRLNISSTGELCSIDTFQIDQDYKPITFNHGELIKRLVATAKGLSGWTRDKPYKTYNLIRFKIKNGAITQIF